MLTPWGSTDAFTGVGLRGASRSRGVEDVLHVVSRVCVSVVAMFSEACTVSRAWPQALLRFLGRMRRTWEFYSCSYARDVCRMNLLCSVDAGGLVGQTAPSVFTIPLRCHAFAALSFVHVGTCVLGVSSMR